MIHAKHKVAQIIFLLTIALAFLPSLSAASQPPASIMSTGFIAYPSGIYVSLDQNNVITKNALSTGFHLSYEWQYWIGAPALQQLAKNAEFKIVRFFSTMVEPCTNWNDASGTGSFDWSKVNTLLQKIYSIGAEPLVTIGYIDSSEVITPPGMKIDSSTGLPNPQSYALYCKAWVSHMKAMNFPVKFYEVFNEAWWYFYPNFNWYSARAGYFLQLFNACYDAMHQENSQVLVGNDASLHRRFLDYWIANGGKLDLLTFHKYDCDGPSMDDETGLQRAERRYFVTDSLWYGINDARQLWYNAHGVTLPAINSESNWAAYCSPGTDPRLQQVVGAVWTALMLRACILNNVQYDCYFCFSSSKSWELANKPSGGFGFGMINHDDNQPWYPYYVQQTIATSLSIGDNIVSTNTSSSDVRSLAWIHGTTLNILLVCRVDEPRTVILQGLTAQLNVTKIDDSISYVSPRVQTGRLNALDPLNMNGYSVFLLQGET